MYDYVRLSYIHDRLLSIRAQVSLRLSLMLAVRNVHVAYSQHDANIFGWPNIILAAQIYFWLPKYFWLVKYNFGCPNIFLTAQIYFWLPKYISGCPNIFGWPKISDCPNIFG